MHISNNSRNNNMISQRQSMYFSGKNSPVVSFLGYCADLVLLTASVFTLLQWPFGIFSLLLPGFFWVFWTFTMKIMILLGKKIYLHGKLFIAAYRNAYANTVSHSLGGSSPSRYERANGQLGSASVAKNSGYKLSEPSRSSAEFIFNPRSSLACGSPELRALLHNINER